MKQLALLLLTGLTASCFAAQDVPEQTQPDELPLCWQLVKNFWSDSNTKRLKAMGAMEDCLARRKEIDELLADPKLTHYDDRNKLERIRSELGTFERALQRKAKRDAKKLQEEAATVCGGPKAPCHLCPSKTTDDADEFKPTTGQSAMVAAIMESQNSHTN